MRTALIVGINDYPAGGQLEGSVNDARAVAKLIKKNQDGTDNFKVTFAENISRKTDLKEKLVELFRPASDIALFYFAGHGVEDYFGYHIVTPDCKPHDMGVPMNQLHTIIRKSPAKNKVVILDCCHAAGADDETKTTGMATYLHEGVTILASSRCDEAAVEVNGHGVFTNLLIEALEGGAADLNGNISPGGIYAYIDKAMGNGQQRPVFKTNISEFVSLRKVKPQVPEDILQKITELFPDPTKEFALNPSFEFKNNPEEKPLLEKPYADEANVAKFKQLQKLQSIGLVVPVGAEHMFFAAMESKACKLTPLGQHYWRLVSIHSI